MFVLFSVLKIKLDDTADIIIGLVNWEFDFVTFFVSVLKDFGFLFFVENDLDVDSATETTEEAGYFILS